MKKMVLTATFCLLGMLCHAQQTKVIGRLSGIEADSMTMTLINNTFDKQERLDKVPLKKQDTSFEYDLNISEARQLLIYPALKQGQTLKGYIDLFVVPGTTVYLTGTLEDYHLSGAPFYDDC